MYFAAAVPDLVGRRKLSVIRRNITMAATLQQILLAPDTRPQVIADAYTLLERELAEKSGVSGTAVKVAYKTVNTVKPGHIRYMVESLFPDMVEKLEPYWADFSATDGSAFGDYLAGRGEEVSQDLLLVTDARAAASSRPTVIKAYRTVRNSAAKHVQAALPQVADLVLKYAP
jgi:hypothetical protein